MEAGKMTKKAAALRSVVCHVSHVRAWMRAHSRGQTDRLKSKSP